MVNISLDKKQVFVQLFRIYEKEFCEILQYVAPLRQNYNTSSNKIHELHLRVCAEIENLIKEVAKDIFFDFDFESDFKSKEKNKLDRLVEQISDQTTKDQITKLFSRKPDFPYFLNKINKETSICSKKIKFCKDLELVPNDVAGFYIHPFRIKDKIDREEIDKKDCGFNGLPYWWHNYNQLKHDKIANYTLCTLYDLIKSMGGYYILLNYLVFGSEIKMEINKPPYNDITRSSLNNYRPNELNIDSDSFMVSTCLKEESFAIYHLANEISISEISEKNQILDNNPLIPHTNSELQVIEHLYYSFNEYIEIPTINLIKDANGNITDWQIQIVGGKKTSFISFVNNKNR